MANLLKMIEKAAESFENLAIHNSRCLQTISERSKCSVCIDACPTNGIQIQSGAIDVSNCISCGICAKVCPTDTFIWKYPTYESLHTKIKKSIYHNETVIISCIKSPLNILEAPLIQIPCFSYLLDDIWTFLLNMEQGYIYLPEDACNECNHICEIPEKIKRIRLYNERDARAILNKESNIDRRKREFLAGAFAYVNKGSLRKWLKNDEVTKESSSSSISIKQTWKKEVCEMPIQVVEKSRPMGIAINSNCRGCRACSILCPEGALEQSKNDAEKATIIKIDHDRCSTCRLCIDICFFDAISIEEKKNHQALEHFHF